jgi:hypothetical protein
MKTMKTIIERFEVQETFGHPFALTSRLGPAEVTLKLLVDSDKIPALMRALRTGGGAFHWCPSKSHRLIEALGPFHGAPEPKPEPQTRARQDDPKTWKNWNRP